MIYFQDEVVSLSNAVPNPLATGQISPAPDGDDDQGPTGEDVSVQLPVPDVLTVDALAEVAPLVVPAAMFKPINYHPLHIFVSIKWYY